MINTFNLDKASASALAPLVEQIAKRADANKDGNVSTSEFAQFLTDLLTRTTAATSRTVERDVPAKPLGPDAVARNLDITK
ncbi:MAG: hypothetical protein ABI051_11580 [Vicinamibacterales bacterium]